MPIVSGLKMGNSADQYRLATKWFSEYRVGEATDLLRETHHQYPHDAETLRRLLFILAYTCGSTPGEFRKLAETWNQLPVSKTALSQQCIASTRIDDDLLRVGYLSGDFRNSVIANVLRPLFLAHDRKRFHITAYSTNPNEDEFTRHFKYIVDAFVPIGDLDDATAAMRISEDSIDILVDVAGHLPWSRPGIMLRRPARKHLHLHGFMATTGISTMDGWIGDNHITPIEFDSHFTERVYRLSRPYMVWDKDHPTPPAVTADRSDGRCWLGSFNNLKKISEPTIALWSRILHQHPQTGLYLKSAALGNSAVRTILQQRFESYGISSDRLRLRSRADTPSHNEHLAEYGHLDIALDPIAAHSGVHTTCDALWMGLPAVTLQGDRMAERTTAGLLHTLERSEWVAESTNEYVAMVGALIDNRDLRSELRRFQRDQMADSLICDRRDYAEALESTFETIIQSNNDLVPT